MLDAKLYAIGGHLEQNRRSDALCFVLDLKTGAWSKIATLPNACAAVAVAALLLDRDDLWLFFRSVSSSV